MKSYALKKDRKEALEHLVLTLNEFGYERVEAIQSPGQYSHQGGILNIYPVKSALPVKADFFGDLIDNLYSFDLQSGQKESDLPQVEITANILELFGGIKVKRGDYIVHEDYGIGLFSNLGMKKVEGQWCLYIFLEYQDGNYLYLPKELSEKISTYIGVGRKKPRLSRLGSQSWQKTYKKTYESIIKLARELISLYATRSIASKKPWKIDQSWDQEIRSTFPYIDTADQANAVSDVYADLGKNYPMDRLIAGDVGFGKTEVAIRVAAQSVANGFQVVILVPTTILVEQHYVNFKNRFQNLPVNIEHLSRLVNNHDQKRVVEAVGAGGVDILIGTHRLLAEDIKFRNLGLYIIDEEQRFGVKQKEKLKQIRTEVNVLALSATPIPRTLFMSLSGIRDISQINIPPKGRKEIKTEVSGYDENKIAAYVRREISRVGQIYYLHNEVATIEGKRIKLKKDFPDLSIEVAHGQMSEERLASAMSRFAERKIQILVCSTIIENGLDLSNVNTLIIEEADRFGLAQLYQIRGRIGRSPRQAYALLTYPDKKLTDNAYKRLQSLLENVGLGSGFNIAMSDLEIRGGGNVLGREQHGNMEAIGLVLYSKLLKSAVSKLRGLR